MAWSRWLPTRSVRAAALLHLAVEYAKERHQFGRAIGSFQAIKHKLANMHIGMHGAHLAVDNAAEALDSDLPTAARMAAIAGSFSRTTAVKSCGDAIQAHGGIGFTWEHDCHLLFKRATLDEFLLSDAREQLDEFAGLIIPASA